MKRSIKYFSTFLIIIFVVGQFVVPKNAKAACGGVVYVNPTGNNTTGCSWANAFTTLQTAIAVATSGDQIWVAAGTYYPDEGSGQSNNNRNSTFTLKNGVNVYGGFAGTETQLSQRDPSANVTVLSGDIGTVGVSSDNAYHVVTALSINATTVLDGVTIRDGYVETGNDFGGGVYISNSTGALQLTGVTFTSNYAGNGGGMAAFVSSPMLTRVIFSNNTAARYGGGIYNQDGSPVLVDVIFDNNQTQQPASPGGGMHSTNSNAAVYTVAPSLTNVTFSNNRALQGGGGGMFNFESNAILTNVTFSGNSAFVRGGAMLNEGSRPILNNVTFSGNTAPAGTGGAIRNIYASGVISSVPVIRNTILWGNGSEEIITDAGSSVTIVDSVVQGGCPTLGTCSNILTTNPNLGSLANNGGFTQTKAISAGSSAIDTGNTATCAVTDQRGVARPQGSGCDIGAYEFEAPAIPTNTPVPPTATFTPAPPTATFTPTNTSVPPTATYTPTDVPTSTPTNTAVPPTATYTPTDVPTLTPTFTPTNTSVPATATFTPTFTATSTNTPVSPTATFTPTFTATSTNTPVPPTATFTLTPTFTPTNTATFTPSATNTPVSTDILYLSSTTDGTAGSVAFADEDILSYNRATSTWSMYFDGSDVGITSDIDAFFRMSDGTILLSVDTDGTVGTFGTVDDSDIIRFTPTSLGTTTAGSFTWYFDGSDVGLTTTAEDIDAIGFAPNGKLVISTLGSFGVTGVSGNDEDLLVFTATALGSTTTGTWALYFDGSDVGLNEATSEQINGIWIEASTNKIYLTTAGAFSVSGLSGTGSDIFICTPGTLGSTTSCTYTSYWLGASNGFAGEIIDGLHIVK